MKTKLFRRSRGQTLLDGQLIDQVVDRAELVGLINHNYTRSTCRMDLECCMMNGTDTLDLTKLLAFPEFDFVHDICGIARHMDRTTWPGKLINCFLPRCSAPIRARSRA